MLSLLHTMYYLRVSWFKYSNVHLRQEKPLLYNKPGSCISFKQFEKNELFIIGFEFNLSLTFKYGCGLRFSKMTCNKIIKLHHEDLIQNNPRVLSYLVLSTHLTVTCPLLKLFSQVPSHCTISIFSLSLSLSPLWFLLLALVLQRPVMMSSLSLLCINHGLILLSTCHNVNSSLWLQIFISNYGLFTDFNPCIFNNLHSLFLPWT